MIETSGHQILDARGIRGSAGAGGNWLFDPDSNVTITLAATTTPADFDGGAPTNTFTPSTNPVSNIQNTDINAILNAGTSVRITTTNNATGNQVGNITVNAPITHAATNGAVTLTLDAGTGGGFGGVGGSVIVNAAITATDAANPLNVVLRANTAGGGVQLNAGGNITTFGGNVVEQVPPVTPFVIVQLIPDGTLVTVPLPVPPPATAMPCVWNGHGASR